MIDVFKIGVAIGMTNNVSQTLRVIQHDLFGLNKTVDLTAKKFNLMKLAALGAMGAIGSAAIVVGMGKLVEAGANVVSQQNQMRIAGMSNLEIVKATSAAWQTTSTVMGTSVVDNLKSIREMRMVFGSTADAIQNLPELAKAQIVVGSILGKNAQDQVFDFSKAGEIKGVSMVVPEFMRFLNDEVKAAIASGGKVTASGFLSAFKYGRAAAQGWDEKFVGQVLPTLIQEMGSRSGGGGSGSGGPGNALMSAYQAIVGGQISNKALPEFLKLHLVDPHKVIYNKVGTVKGVLPGGIKGSAEFAANPYQWTQDVLVPALIKEGYKTPEAMRTEIANLFRNRTAQQVFDMFATQQQRFQKDAALIQSAQGIEAYNTLITSDFWTNWNAFTTGLDNFVDALGVPMVPTATKYLHGLTVEIDKFVLWASKNPTTLLHYEKIALVIAAIVGSIGALAVTVAAVGALGVIFTPLGGIVALLVGLGVAATYAYFHWGKITALLESFWKHPLETFNKLGAVWKGLVIGLSEAVWPIVALIAVTRELVAVYPYIRNDFAKIPALLDEAGNAVVGFFHELAYIATHPLADIKHLGAAIGNSFNGTPGMPTAGTSRFGIHPVFPTPVPAMPAPQPAIPTPFLPPPLPPTPTFDGPIPVHITNPKDIHNGVARSWTQQLNGIQTGPTGFDGSFGLPTPAGAW